MGVDPLAKPLIDLKYPVVIKEGDCFQLPFGDGEFDLVFTCGVLMHVAQGDLPRAAQELSRVSSKYVLIIEYYSPEEVAIPYHGHSDLLFKRDYQSFLPNLVQKGFLSRAEGFDECTTFLFQKTSV